MRGINVILLKKYSHFKTLPDLTGPDLKRITANAVTIPQTLISVKNFIAGFTP